MQSKPFKDKFTALCPSFRLYAYSEAKQSQLSHIGQI